MNASNLVTVGQLAQKSGAKVILYGPPGTGKTPTAMMLPNSVTAVVEKGLASVRNSNTMCADCDNFQKIDEFYKWFLNPTSKDARKFSTHIIDSLSKLCKIALAHYELTVKDPRQAYQKMAKFVINIITGLQQIPNLNVLYLAQMATEEVVVPGPLPGQILTRPYNRPLFPGKQLDKDIPHEIDEIWYVDNVNRPDGVYGPAVHTKDSGKAMARSRHYLNDLEPLDLVYLFNKINAI